MSRKPGEAREYPKEPSGEGPGVESDDPGSMLLGRRVLGSSIVELNKSTHGLSRRMPRVLDVFYTGMVYAHRLRHAREASPLKEPPSMEELIEKFLGIDTDSLHSPVDADVVDVRDQQGEVAVYVDYPSLIDEQTALAKAVTDSGFLDLSQARDMVPNEPRIVIVEDRLTRDSQLERIRATMPDTLRLSAMQRAPGVH